MENDHSPQKSTQHTHMNSKLSLQDSFEFMWEYCRIHDFQSEKGMRERFSLSFLILNSLEDELQLGKIGYIT